MFVGWPRPRATCSTLTPFGPLTAPSAGAAGASERATRAAARSTDRSLGDNAGVALPEDPAAFVAAAERGINDRDLDATLGVYAPAARLESLTDGAWERHDGVEEIRRAWQGYLGAMKARGFWLDKVLTSASGDTIVNQWTGGLGRRTDAHGIEYWRFDDEGRVREHRMYSFLNVKPSRSPLQRLRLTVTYPRTALAFLREQRKAR
jgi:hypothetical protein